MIGKIDGWFLAQADGAVSFLARWIKQRYVIIAISVALLLARISVLPKGHIDRWVSVGALGALALVIFRKHEQARRLCGEYGMARVVAARRSTIPAAFCRWVWALAVPVTIVQAPHTPLLVAVDVLGWCLIMAGDAIVTPRPPRRREAKVTKLAYQGAR